MKKTYTKPEICFESFLMSTNIAGDCDKPFVNNASKGTCGIIGSVPGKDNLFIQSVTGAEGCQMYEHPDDGIWDLNGFCYHVPTEGKNLFNS